MEEKKIKNIRKKLKLLQTQKLNKKKVLCPPEIFFLLCRKNVLYVQTEKNVKKKWRFLFVASRHEKENLKAMEKKWKERLYANKDELVLEYKLISSAKIQTGVVVHLDHLDVYFISFFFCYLQVYTFLNQYQIGWVHFRKKNKLEWA